MDEPMNRYTPADPDDPGLRMLARLRADLTGAPADAKDRMRHAVLHRTLHGGAAGRPGPTTRWRRLTVGATAALALTGLVGGAAVATGLLDRGDPSPATTSPGTALAEPAVTLELVARQAALAPAVPIRAGQYVYVRTESSDIGTYDGGPWGDETVRLRVEGWDELWLDPQGMFPVRTRGEDSRVRPLTARDRAVAERAGLLKTQPQRYDRRNDSYPAQKAELAAKGPDLAGRRSTPESLAGLPTEPGELLVVLRSAAAERAGRSAATGPEADAHTFALVADLFQTYDPIISPELRAALYRAVAKLPGIELVRGGVKLGGHTGIAFTCSVAGKERKEIVLDPASYRFVGVRSNAGGVDESWTVVTDTRVVDAVGRT
ncbi:CU044_5270 family protein [Micromonospora sp. NPDC004336]